MKVFVDIDGGCSCYEVEVSSISTNSNDGGQEFEVKLSDLLGVTSETSIISMIDELITKHQNYVVEIANRVTGLRAAIRDLEVELSHKASEDRKQAAKVIPIPKIEANRQPAVKVGR